MGLIKATTFGGGGLLLYILESKREAGDEKRDQVS
jgi:hypothetical protein